MLRKLFLCFIAAAMMSAGCGGGGGGGVGTPSYTVTFNSKGGSSVAAQSITKGDTVTEPVSALAYYTLTGWYTDEACIDQWDFALDTVAADMTLYAKWTHNSWEDNSVNPLIYTSASVVDTPGKISDLQGTANGDVYVVGEFERFKGQTIRSVAKLSGTTWSQVGKDLDENSAVHSICITPSGDIYIGGTFGYPTALFPSPNGPKAFAKMDTPANNYFWRNVTATDLYIDGGSTPIVNDIICDSAGKLYVVGVFKYAGGTSGTVRNSFAILNGTTWGGPAEVIFGPDGTPYIF